MPDRPRYSRFRRLPGLFRIGDAKVPDPHEEPVPLTVYLPGRMLDLAEKLAARHGAADVQEYCEGLLAMAIEEEEKHGKEHAFQVTHGTLQSLDDLANDPDYLAEWSHSAREHADDPVKILAAPTTPLDAHMDDLREVIFRHAGLSDGPDFGLLPNLRCGDLITSEIVDELLGALGDLEVALRDASTLDRKLAYALHRLAFEGQILVSDSPAGAANDLPTIDSLHRIQEAVDRVLSGDDIRYYHNAGSPSTSR